MTRKELVGRVEELGVLGLTIRTGIMTTEGRQVTAEWRYKENKHLVIAPDVDTVLRKVIGLIEEYDVPVQDL